MQNEGSGSDGEDGSESDSDNEKATGGGDGSNEAGGGGQSTVEEEDEEAEWEKFQKKMNKYARASSLAASSSVDQSSSDHRLFFQARKGSRGQEPNIAFRPLSILHGRQARVLVGVHRRQEEPRTSYAAQHGHLVGGQGGGRIEIHCASKAR